MTSSLTKGRVCTLLSFVKNHCQIPTFIMFAVLHTCITHDPAHVTAPFAGICVINLITTLYVYLKHDNILISSCYLLIIFQYYSCKKANIIFANGLTAHNTTVKKLYIAKFISEGHLYIFLSNHKAFPTLNNFNRSFLMRTNYFNCKNYLNLIYTATVKSLCCTVITYVK